MKGPSIFNNSLAPLVLSWAAGLSMPAVIGAVEPPAAVRTENQKERLLSQFDPHTTKALERLSFGRLDAAADGGLLVRLSVGQFVHNNRPLQASPTNYYIVPRGEFRKLDALTQSIAALPHYQPNKDERISAVRERLMHDAIDIKLTTHILLIGAHVESLTALPKELRDLEREMPLLRN